MTLSPCCFTYAISSLASLAGTWLPPTRTMGVSANSPMGSSALDGIELEILVERRRGDEADVMRGAACSHRVPHERLRGNR